MEKQNVTMRNDGHKSIEISAVIGQLPTKIKYSSDEITLSTYSHDLWPRTLLEIRDEAANDYPRKAPNIGLVLWPESRDEVIAIVRWVEANDFFLIPYGAGSGVCGATMPTPREERPRVLVDMKRMRKVLSIDRTSMTVTAECGIIGENLERHLNQEGFTLGHFPSSIYCSSLGGYLAARSAGQMSTKYGKIEDMVLSTECVFPGGIVIETGRAPRSAMGPDFTQLFLGSEGTLCLFTNATLQIHALPELRILNGFVAETLEGAVTFSRQLMQKGIRPSVLRIYDPLESSLLLSSDLMKGKKGAAIVTVFEGPKRLVDAEFEEAKALATELGVSNIGAALGDHWWEHRYDVSYNQQLIVSHKRVILDTFEIASTWTNILKVYDAVKAERPPFGIILAHFSHFYHTGANIYFTFVSHAGLELSAIDHYDRVWNNIMNAALGAGATLSHHHGVGLQKNELLRRERPELTEIFRKIKYAIDPKDTFNPGKIGL